MLDEMKEAGRSKHSGTVIKKKTSSGRSIKRRRVVNSGSESSDNSSDSSSQKVYKFHKRSAVYEGAYSENREFETKNRVSNGLDVFEFDEYDGFVYSRDRKDVNGGRHGWNSNKKSGDRESESGRSRPTYSRSRLEMDDDDFDLPLSVLSKKYRSSSKKHIGLQEKNVVSKVLVKKNEQMGVSHRSCDQKESKHPHKKKLDQNDHKGGGDGQSSRTDDTNCKEKGELKSLNPMVDKSSKKVNENDTVMQSKSNIIVETVKKSKIVKEVKDKDSSVKHDSRTEKQILREKIKNMLLGAGWTIAYRPRQNRNYMDAIYTNPAGTAYWSIIKAYKALEKQEEDNDEDGGISTPLPVEILGKSESQTQKKIEKETKKRSENEGNCRNAKRGMEDTVSDYEEELNSYGRKSRSSLLVRDSNKVPNSENDGFCPWTILAWLIESGVVDMNEHVEYMNGRRTRVLQKGRVTRDGIHCGCCNKILTVLKFEQHSGSKLCNPFPNMVLKSGKSLMQCQIEAWNKLGELEKKGFYTADVHGDDPNDDTCGVCGDGGDLICCDGCPSTFHQSCLDIEMLPEGDWLCPNCSCKYCEMAGGNTEASFLSCCLCYKKYHESCRPGIDVKPHEPKSLDLSFCGQECHEVYAPLQKLVGVKHELDSGFSWSLIHRSDGEERVECNSMLVVAMSVMDECFLPFTDRRSGINLIRNVVFNCGSNLSRLNYSGFYTAVLERGDEAVCAASIRLHGTQLAEMPFIGTRHIYRRQGMCRRLLSAIESALSALQVEKLMIPAIAEHMNTWTDVFGFRPLEESHKQEMKSVNMLVFPGTDMLQKPLVKQAIHKGNKTSEVEPREVIAQVSEKNGESGGCCLDASKESLSIHPPVKDELQLPGKESDSIHSLSDDIPGNGTNPVPSDNLFESRQQVGCTEPKFQHPGEESDSILSYSDSKGNGTNPEQGSCGNERNRGIPGAVLDDVELISSNVGEVSDKIAITESGSLELDMRKENEMPVPVSGDDSNGRSTYACFDLNVEASCLHDSPHKIIASEPNFQHQCDSVPSHSHSHSKLDQVSVQNGSVTDPTPTGNNIVDKNTTTDSISQEFAATLEHGYSLDASNETLHLSSPVKDESPRLQLPEKESDSIQSHSDSKVDEMDVQNVIPSDIPCQSHTALPKLQQTREHSDSRVHEIDVQNTSGTNTLPAEIHDPSRDAIPHEQDPAASSSQPNSNKQ